MFVTFEGIEGSGKSTLVGLVADSLRAQGHDILATREPGGTPLGDGVRAIFLDPQQRITPISEAMLVNASRAQLCEDVIRPALRAGKVVLCDRFFDATVAYQGYGRELDIEGLVTVCLVATGGLSPDLTILLDLPVPESLRRVRARASHDHVAIDRLERESVEFHERVRAGYLQIAQRSSRFVVLDAMLESSTLADASLEHIERMRARISHAP